METQMNDEYDHVNEFVFYTSSNIPGKGSDPSLFESSISTFCSCEDGCRDVNMCACLRQCGRNYENEKLIGEKMSGNGSCFECNENCTCRANRCGNRVVQFGPASKLSIRAFEGKGYGLVSEKPIKKGQFICEYAGEVIGKHEATERRKVDSANYIFTLNEFIEDRVIETIIDATCIANIGRYINHSCDPNCVVVPVRADSLVPKLSVFAVKNIEAGEEITYSYNGIGATGMTDCDTVDRKLCLCGAKNCAIYLPYNP